MFCAEINPYTFTVKTSKALSNIKNLMLPGALFFCPIRARRLIDLSMMCKGY